MKPPGIYFLKNRLFLIINLSFFCIDSNLFLGIKHEYIFVFQKLRVKTEVVLLAVCKYNRRVRLLKRNVNIKEEEVE